MTKHSILDVAAVLDPPLIHELLNWITFLNLKTTNFGEGLCVPRVSFFFPKKKLEWSHIKLENFKQIRRSKSLETDGMHFI